VREGQAGDANSEVRPSRYSDVCGTVDELKRVLFEEPEIVPTDPASLDSLLGDALGMLDRMETRLTEYEAFGQEITAVAAALSMIETGLPPVEDEAAALRALLSQGHALTDQQRDQAVVYAEAVRAVAQGMENRLYRYKELALALGRAYQGVMGGRHWVLTDPEEQTEAPLPGEPAWSRWLPSSPHRERILRYLSAGRAHLAPPTGAEEGPPLIQFEDGGLMPLPVVRWSEEVRNFHPADAPPHQRGLLYRQSDAREG